MKKLLIAALLFFMPAAVFAGPYVGAGALFDSVSLKSAGTVPTDLSGYAIDAGYRWRDLSAGVEYSSAQAANNGNDLVTSRIGLGAAYHFEFIPSVDTYVGAGVGRSTYHADGSTFAAGKTTTSRLFSGSETDWNVGAGAIIPVYDLLKLRVTGRYQPTEFGGRATGGIVLGIGLVLAR